LLACTQQAKKELEQGFQKMALSHLNTRRGKMLCGLFFGSTMALYGLTTAHANDDHPEHNDHPGHDDHAHSLIAEEAIISTIENIQPVTGEERLNVAIPFADLPTHGDPRIKSLIAAFQRTALGREMYNYAVAEGTSLQWEADDDKRVGAYFHNKNLITLDARSSNDSIMLTLAHEIRHAWQFRTLDVTAWALSPKDRWSASRLIEADSCAFTAHYVADYHKETGIMLNAQKSYNRFLIEDYVKKPERQRDYIKDAFEPCFRKVEDYYNDLHVDAVKHYFNQNRAVYYRVENSNSLKNLTNAFDSGFNMPPNNERARLFKGFFTLSVTKDGGTPVPQISRLDTLAFLDWIAKQTPFTRPEDDVEVARMSAEFYAMRLQLLRGANNKSAKPRP
jgi:hypothetical protein